MKSISFLTLRWFLIVALLLIGIAAVSQEVSAGTPGNEPVFEISALTISPAEANTGQTITIGATIKETNNISGVYEATLKINGVVEETKSLSIGPEASEQVTFSVSKNVAGTYSVDLDGLTGSFTVTGEPVSDSGGSSFPTVPVVIGIVAALVIAGLLIFYLNRRKVA